MNKSFKKLASCLLSAAVAVSAYAGVFAESFSDMPNDWRTAAIENAVANGLISGMGDGTVAPDANITRAQMAAIIVRALGARNAADISMFADVSQDAWYYDELAKAVYMNAFSGDGQNMNPENNITFQECFTVLSRVFGLYYRTTEADYDLSAGRPAQIYRPKGSCAIVYGGKRPSRGCHHRRIETDGGRNAGYICLFFGKLGDRR